MPAQDSIVVGLLDASIRNLQAQGMKRMFLDGISNGLTNFEALGRYYFPS